MHSGFNLLIDRMAENGINAVEGDYFRFDARDLRASPYYETAQSVYHKLGGVMKEPPVTDIRPFALLNGNAFLEIDDHLQFNRYRMATLRSPFYAGLKGVDEEQYKRYCRMHEKECLKSALTPGQWTSAEAELYFGPAAEPGDFFGNGSPGWKLSAYYSFLEDLFVATTSLKIIRIAVYDQVMVSGRIVRVKELFAKRADHAPLIQLILKRLEQLAH